MNRQLTSTRPASPPVVEVTPHRSRFIEVSPLTSYKKISKCNLSLFPYEFVLLLQELEALLNTSMNALENDTNCTSPGTSMSFNDRYPYSSTSLHEMQMQVREASQRCKEFGIPYVSNSASIAVSSKSRNPIPYPRLILILLATSGFPTAACGSRVRPRTSHPCS